MFIIKSNALRILTNCSLALFGFASLNACQLNTEIPAAGHRGEFDRSLATASALRQAERFWPRASLFAQPLQVAALPARHTAPTGAIGVQLQFSRINPPPADYRLQANQSGQAAATLSDVMALRLFLVDASLGLPTGSVMPVPSGGDIFTVNTVSTNQNILFTQVPTGDYYVCAAAFNSSVGPFLPVANLTSADGGASYGEGNVRCSDGGGNGDGSISVGSAPAYTVSNTTALSINLNLKSATGATIEFNATVTDG